MNTAFDNTERIKAIFLDTQSFYVTHDNMPALMQYLENTDREFRSIAYESASTAIAIKDLEDGQFPAGWQKFAEGPGLLHTAQVYVGLGWAIAKLNLPFLETLEELDNKLYFRIADGCGYYDGSFRRRQAVLSQQLPAYIPAAALPMYDQGLGRSLWYTTKTDINKIHSLIETFPVNRQADLWRGMGIAVAYVGGCSDADLKTLFQFAGTNAPQLACGAGLAARSRLQANAFTKDTDGCSRLWFRLTANNSTFQEGDVGAAHFETNYNNWIDQVEAPLSAGFEN